MINDVASHTTILSEYAGSISVRIRIFNSQSLVYGIGAHDTDYRAEDLFACYTHFGLHIINNSGAYISTIFFSFHNCVAPVHQHFGTIFFRLGYIAFNSVL